MRSTQNKKRILSVTIKRMVDDSPDTSWLGEYSNRPTSEYSIDRAHSEDCASVRPDIQEAKDKLERVQQIIGEMWNENIKKDDTETIEHNSLDAAYDDVGELIDAVDECDCGNRGDMQRNEYRYFNPYESWAKNDTKTDKIACAHSQYERMESLHAGNWCFIGIRADAQVAIPDKTCIGLDSHHIVQDITSGGLWGIESDSDDSYLESVEKEELASLKTQLKSFGFSSRAISSAFKTIERKDS